MRRTSLRVRMVAVFSLLIIGVAAFMIEFFPARMAEQARAQAELRARTIAQVMASAVAPALEFDDADNASKVLAHLASTPDARFAVVLDESGTRFAAWQPAAIPARLPHGVSSMEGKLLIASAQIVGRGGGRGTLYVGQSLDRMIAAREAARDTVVSASIVVLAIGLAICVLLATALVRPLERLTTIARDIGRGAKPPRITAMIGGREVLEMTHALGSMLDRVQDANRQLVEASRHAGMAEVATGVLHNVGNVLTSINVGVSSLAEHAGALPVDRLRRAGDLLAGSLNGGAIEPRKLEAGVRYLAAVADQVAALRDRLLADAGALRGHVDHVNRAVAMQNAFARTCELTEEVELAVLVEEAVALGCPDAELRGVTITREVQPAVRVSIDRHRVLQIAVNLIANARDSVTERRRRLENADAPPGRVALRATARDGWLELVVDDDGGGISPETLARIFNAGFTTKPKGHGYGLHSSALAAEHLQGTLRCSSAGIDRGASFVLRIPVETASSHD